MSPRIAPFSPPIHKAQHWQFHFIIAKSGVHRCEEVIEPARPVQLCVSPTLPLPVARTSHLALTTKVAFDFFADDARAHPPDAGLRRNVAVNKRLPSHQISRG